MPLLNDLCFGKHTRDQEREFNENRTDVIMMSACVYEGGSSASEIRSKGELKWDVAGAEQVLKYRTTFLSISSRLVLCSFGTVRLVDTSVGMTSVPGNDDPQQAMLCMC